MAASCGILPLFALTLYGKAWRIPAWAAIGAIVTVMAATDLMQVTRSKSYDEKSRQARLREVDPHRPVDGL